ncbi:MAG: polysaccharide biosynthesis/export family protein, partial [Alphaproteobacteria bacterium]
MTGNETIGQEAAGVAAEAQQEREREQAEAKAEPFGANLFSGQFAANRPGGINPDYLIAPGDRISVNVFGAETFSETLPVDNQGNLFLPGVGPLKVAGVPNRLLQSTVEGRIREIFTEEVQIYVNLLGAQTLGVFVTGAVAQPGRYAGLPGDPALAFIDLAGGIDLERGSFRNVAILRDGKEIARLDLYDFLLRGSLPKVRFQEGDVILVGPIGGAVAVTGDARAAAAYE